MRNTILFLVALMASVAVADPVYYFEMRQYTVEQPPFDQGAALVISNVALTNADHGAQATNLMNEFAADPDYFGATNNPAWDAHIHAHNPTTCFLSPIGEHRSDKTPLSKWITMRASMTNDLAETWILAVTDDADAKRKQKKVEDRDKSKTFKVEKHL